MLSRCRSGAEEGGEVVAATYDEINLDKKVTLEAQLGLIGGTMGLLTGFSILSGIEMVYYAVKFFMSLKESKLDIMKSKPGNHLY